MPRVDFAQIFAREKRKEEEGEKIHTISRSIKHTQGFLLTDYGAAGYVTLVGVVFSPATFVAYRCVPLITRSSLTRTYAVSVTCTVSQARIKKNSRLI